MTKSIALEKGKDGQHCTFSQHEPLPFERKNILGSGGFEQVDRVLSLISFREYTRKQVRRDQAFGRSQKEGIRYFIGEIEILKRLKHYHIVEFVGSYTDPNYMGLIMLPVADMDLSTYFERADTTKQNELRTFFGCLARALEFLHARRIRHKDIKPSNILVKGGNVLFTDFGLSYDFTDANDSTIVRTVNALTPRYCAPEVATYAPRNTASDIWSLGVVFLEMTTVLKERTVEDMNEYLGAHGSQQVSVRLNLDGVDNFITELQRSGSVSDNVLLEWVRDMLQERHELRPTAASLVRSITTACKGRNKAFCGICCLLYDDVSNEAAELKTQ